MIGAGVGVAELLILRSKESDITTNKCVIDPNTGTASSTQCATLGTSRDQARVGSIVAFSAAGALAITSVVLFVTSSSPTPSAALRWSPHPGTMLVCAPSLLTPGAACQLRF